MDIARSIALFGVAVVAEIGGACLVWHRMKRELLAADVTWGDSRPPPAVRVKRGAEEIAAYFARLQKANFQAEPLVTAAQGDYVIDVHRGWPSCDDATLDMHWVLVYRIEAGRIAEVENYAADHHAADLFFTRVWGEDLKPIPGPAAELTPRSRRTGAIVGTGSVRATAASQTTWMRQAPLLVSREGGVRGLSSGPSSTHGTHGHRGPADS